MLDMSTFETGCVVDGARGRYALPTMLIVAHDLGWTPEEGAQYLSDLLAAYESDAYSDTYDAISSMAVEAEYWLNDETPDGYLWHWFDGEFRLDRWCGNECAFECDDDECACHTMY